MGFISSRSNPQVILPAYTLDSNLVLLPGIVYNVLFLRFKAASLLLRYQNVVPEIAIVKNLLNEYEFEDNSNTPAKDASNGSSKHPGRMSGDAADGVKKFNLLFQKDQKSLKSFSLKSLMASNPASHEFNDFILAITPNLVKIVDSEDSRDDEYDQERTSAATVVRIIGITDDTTSIRLTFQAITRAVIVSPGTQKLRPNELKVAISMDPEVFHLKQEFARLYADTTDLFLAIDTFITDYRHALATSTSVARKKTGTRNGTASDAKAKDNAAPATPDSSSASSASSFVAGDLLILNPLANAFYLQLAGSKDFVKASNSLQSIYNGYESDLGSLDSASFLRLIDLTAAIMPFPSSQKLRLLLKQKPSDRVVEITNMIHSLIDVFDAIRGNNEVLNHWFYQEASNPQKASLIANQLKSIRLILEGMSKLNSASRNASGVTSRQLVRKSNNPLASALGNYRPNSSSSASTPASRNGNEDDGDDDDDLRVINNFFKKQLPSIQSIAQDAKRLLIKDYKRIKSSPPGNLDYHVIRNYLEIVADLPWDKYVTTYQSNRDIDIDAARQQLDRDHYGLEHVKQRLIQYLVVLKLLGIRAESNNDLEINSSIKSAEPSSNEKNVDSNANGNIVIENYEDSNHGRDTATKTNERTRHEVENPNQVSLEASRSGKAPIILLAGPPGTGKTSLAKSIADLLGRKFQRVALGGVRDEAEIRGHRRTYVGAMPGVIVQALRKLRSMNPVILLDEIDKVIGGTDGAMKAHGDPAAALLEVLDPEQNTSFNDHYLGFPVDLSQVIFVCTANEPHNLSRPLLDRLEMIEVGAYDFNEKAIIGKKYLLPRQIKRNGFPSDELIDISEEVMEKIIVDYTREAGVRNFERKLGTICRFKAVEFASSLEDGTNKYNPVVDISSLPRYLGIPYTPISKELQEPFQSNKFGVVNGLSYNTDGSGSVLVFESIGFAGNNYSLNMTGRLGEVLMESAKIGSTFIKLILSRKLLNLDNFGENYLEKLEKMEIHLHVPAGAIQKDGPSAGITMALLFLSLILEKPVPSDIAMTGEITLRGSVLPIGGIKEKLLGAHFSGIKKVILPRENRKDIIKEYCYGINDDSKLNDFLIDNDSKVGYKMCEPEIYFEKRLGIELVYANEFWDVIKAVWGNELLVKVEQARMVECHL